MSLHPPKQTYHASYLVYTIGYSRPEMIHTDKDEITDEEIIAISEQNPDKIIAYGIRWFQNGEEKSFQKKIRFLLEF